MIERDINTEIAELLGWTNVHTDHDADDHYRTALLQEAAIGASVKAAELRKANTE